MRFHVILLILLVVLSAAASAPGQVFSSEFASDPVSEDWECFQQYCDPTVWVEDGWYQQVLEFPSCDPPGGGQEDYYRWLTDFLNVRTFFLQFRVETDGDRSEIPWGAPTVVALFNFFGISYNATVARDQVNFLRDVGLPILFIDVEPDVPHTIYLALYNDEPATYHWYIDGEIVDEGLAEGPFPVMDARITWRGKASYFPCHNRWDYIRYGVIPVDGSGDWDSDGDVDMMDYYRYLECFTGPDVNAGPGCRFADFDADTDVDVADFAGFQAAISAPQ